MKDLESPIMVGYKDAISFKKTFSQSSQLKTYTFGTAKD